MPTIQSVKQPKALQDRLAGVPLSIVFADTDAIEAIRNGRSRSLPLTPPFHVSDGDAYFVLPDDIGVEIVDILRDGDGELLAEALRDGLIAIGEVSRVDKGRLELLIEHSIAPRALLSGGLPYACPLELDGNDDIVQRINSLDALQCTMTSELVDDEGMEAILRSSEYIGASWRAPADAPSHVRGAEPTYVWTRHTRPGGRQIGCELALFVEYDELVMLFRPFAIDVSDRPTIHA